MIIKTSYSFMKPPPSARLIRGHRLAQNLASAWTMAENGGSQVFDSSGNNSEAVNQNNVTWTSSKFGSAMNFPGAAAGDFLLISGDALDLQVFSIVAGIQHDSNGLARTIKGNTISGYQFRLTTNDKLGLLKQEVSNIGESTNAVPSNELVQVAVTYSSPLASFYINGKPDGTASSAQTFTHSVHTIGARETTSTIEIYKGLMSHIYIYNRVLSASEIAELYLRPFCMFERKARTALLSGYEVVAPPVGMAGAMTTNTGYWGY